MTSTDTTMSVKPGLGSFEGSNVNPTRTDTGLGCLVAILRFFELPADPQQIRHVHGTVGKPMSATEIVRAAVEMGLKARLVRSKISKLAETPFPAIVRLRENTFVVLGKIVGDRVILMDPSRRGTDEMPVEEFREAWTGEIILASRRSRLFEEAGKFDITWFIPAFLKYKHIFGEVLIASAFVQVFALAAPLFFQVIVDKVLGHQGLTTLDVLIFALVVVSVFEVVLGLLRTYIFEHSTHRVDVELGAQLYKHLVALPISFFERRPVGTIVARVRELDTVQNFISGSALILTIDLAFTFIFIAVMWYLSPKLTGIVLFSLPFYIVLAVVVTPILRRRVEEQFQRGAKRQAFLVESISGLDTIKAMAVEPQSQRRWEEELAEYTRSAFRANHLQNIAGQTSQLISKITSAATLYFGALLVLSGDMTVGQLVAFNMLSGRVTGPILRLSQLWNEFQQMRVAIDKLGDILNAPKEPGYNANRVALRDLQGAIEFENVSFRYDLGSPYVLENLNLKISPGQVIGIIGASGSGKSTLAKLVQRLYIPSNGRVMIDGVDLAGVDTAWLRRQVGVVPQENLLFGASVRDNIALSDPGMPMHAVIDAAKLAGAHLFISELPNGYDTMVGERGSNLSGGQRQRIAIARALLRKPRILILDEATSALDFEAEAQLQKNMARIGDGRTVVIIAHRLSTVKDAHRIITLDRGRIVEDGSPSELLEQGGTFARLWNSQMVIGNDENRKN